MSSPYFNRNNGNVIVRSSGPIVACSTCPCPGCIFCTPQYQPELSVTISGITNLSSGCTECSTYNGTFIVQRFGTIYNTECFYEYIHGSSPCSNFDHLRVQIGSNGTGGVSVNVQWLNAVAVRNMEWHSTVSNTSEPISCQFSTHNVPQTGGNGSTQCQPIGSSCVVSYVP